MQDLVTDCYFCPYRQPAVHTVRYPIPSGMSQSLETEETHQNSPDVLASPVSYHSPREKESTEEPDAIGQGMGSVKEEDSKVQLGGSKKSYEYEYISPNPELRERLKRELQGKDEEKPTDSATEGDKVKRLNPKLTRRAYVYDYEPPRPELRDQLVQQLIDGPPSPSNSESDSIEGSVDAEAVVRAELTPQDEPVIMNAEMKKKMLHPGKWVPPEYIAGKLQKETGMWMCCTSREQYSIYCTSLHNRQKQERYIIRKEEEKVKALRYADYVEDKRRGPWERQEIQTIEQEPRNTEKILMEKANAEESTLNGPMLISWTHKNMNDPRTALSGLNYLLRNLHTGEGCVLFHRHEGCDTILKAYNYHPKHSEILLTCAKLWQQLLDCNLTRNFLVNDTIVLKALFSIANRYMKSVSHVTVALRGMMQCSRAEVCRQYILEENLLGYFTLFCKSFSKNANVIRPVLRSFNWVSTTDERLVRLFKLGCVNTTIKCMDRHISDPAVLAPALLFLTRVAAIHLPAAEYIVRKKAIPTVVNALRALYSNELLQVEGLKMLRALSKSEEGWDQISKMKGGWQAICQGTAVGDALIHELPGSFHNPGWCIGETPHLPLLERRKLAVAALSAAANQASRIKPKGAWTTHSLRQFMGLTMKPTRLAVNNEEHDVHFEVISTLDLLPHPREEKEEWFGRVNGYETENGIKINDMVEALISMRLKKKLEDKIALKESLIEDEEKEYIKPIYVAGKLFNQKDVEESDKNLADHLAGVVDDTS